MKTRTTAATPLLCRIEIHAFVKDWRTDKTLRVMASVRVCVRCGEVRP